MAPAQHVGFGMPGWFIASLLESGRHARSPILFAAPFMLGAMVYGGIRAMLWPNDPAI